MVGEVGTLNESALETIVSGVIAILRGRQFGTTA